jgi:Asp-tRNA(Asn)/Glu-tRNA(Gln) amidotransferase A subunit family amidase
MSYGLTGLNEHYGQVKNPYNEALITGGSSSCEGASVAARIVPAAFAGLVAGAKKGNAAWSSERPKERP